MNDWVELMLLAAAMLATGAVGGLLAGLLGVGGGIVIVPVLDFTLGLLGVDAAIRMHVAVATSLATIIPTSISSSRAHHGRGAVDLALARSWGVWILAGSIVGSWLAAKVDSSVLSLIFACVALLVAAKMLLPFGRVALSASLPSGPSGKLLPLGIGGFSSMMGIGGGTLSVPIMTLCSYPMHRAVGTAALFGLLISVPATVAYIVMGWDDPRLPVGSFGYLNLVGFMFIAPTTVLLAPWGARLAHRLSQRQLAFAFGAFLLLVALRMFYRSLA